MTRGSEAVDALVERWLGHVWALADGIGPRGPTTEGERRGHDYCEEQLRAVGLSPVRDRFRSARSIFRPHLYGAVLLLAAFAVYPWAGRATAVAAVLLSWLVLVSELLELTYRDNPLRRLVPHGDSQNVYAVVEPAGEVKRDLLLVGHVDSQRTPFLFRSPTLVRVFATFTLVVFLAIVVQAVLFTLGAIWQWSWVWPATVPSAVAALLLAAMCVEADASPFTAGANDNASAVGLVLELARQYAADPLPGTRVWAVCTGCEEARHYGMADFLARHAAELVDPRAIVLEMVGVAGPSYLLLEGVVVPFRADPGMVALCEQVAASHPDLDAYPMRITGGNTEMADAVKAGIPAVTIVGVTRDLVGPYWHQRSDTPDKMVPDTMARTYRFVTALGEAVDAGTRPSSR